MIGYRHAKIYFSSSQIYRLKIYSLSIYLIDIYLYQKKFYLLFYLFYYFTILARFCPHHIVARGVLVRRKYLQVRRKYLQVRRKYLLKKRKKAIFIKSFVTLYLKLICILKKRIYKWNKN